MGVRECAEVVGIASEVCVGRVDTNLMQPNPVNHTPNSVRERTGCSGPKPSRELTND